MGAGRAVLIAGCFAVVGVQVVNAQEPARAARSGRRALLPRAEEIVLARSAAPASVSDSATVYVLADTGFVVAVRGSNGAACFVDRSWSLALEPHCFDAEGAATIMLMHMRHLELVQRGVSYEDAERQLATELSSGRFRLPRRPAMSYMMSAEQLLYDDEGKRVGNWQPHLMIYYPFLRNADIGASAPDISAAAVDNEGQPDASMVIVVKKFVQPVRSGSSR